MSPRPGQGVIELPSVVIHARAALLLGAVALATGLLAALALQDIYPGEPDVTTEWRIVQVAALAAVAFLVAAMSALGRVAGGDGRGHHDGAVDR